jgi:branched-chain amino acid transport system substrate-binding protein
MYEPLHPMKFSYFVSYRDQARGGIAYMVENHDISKVCLQTAANDYGEEVAIGFEQAVEEHGLDVVYTGRHKGSETDFTGTITSIKNSGCELLFLGPFIKDTILIYTAARDAGWDAPVMANMVPYMPSMAVAADGGMNGMYSVASFRLPDYDAEVAADSWIGQWYTKYLDRYGSEPGAQSTIGYVIADLTVRALEAAGPEVTTDKVLAGLEAISRYEDPFGGPSLSFSAEKHQGGDYLDVYQIQGSKWVTVAEGIEY